MLSTISYQIEKAPIELGSSMFFTSPVGRYGVMADWRINNSELASHPELRVGCLTLDCVAYLGLDMTPV